MNFVLFGRATDIEIMRLGAESDYEKTAIENAVAKVLVSS